MRPYDVDSIRPYERIMTEVPTTLVDVSALFPTQDKVRIDRLIALARGYQAEGPDLYPHVVAHNGRLWIHNGHHRWLCALLRGDTTLEVRIEETSDHG